MFGVEESRAFDSEKEIVMSIVNLSVSIIFILKKYHQHDCTELARSFSNEQVDYEIKVHDLISV